MMVALDFLKGGRLYLLLASRIFPFEERLLKILIRCQHGCRESTK